MHIIGAGPSAAAQNTASQAPLANIKALMTMQPPFRCNRQVLKPRSCGLNGLTWKPRTLGSYIRHSKGKLHDQLTWPKEKNCPHLVTCKLDHQLHVPLLAPLFHHFVRRARGMMALIMRAHRIALHLHARLS